MAVIESYQISPVDVGARQALDLRAGDTVRVHQKIQEKGKIRIQIFEGLLIARKHGTEPGATFTVRKVASGVGTEKIFPLYSPNIDKIEVVRRSRVRRSKLYYIRDKATKEIRKKMRFLVDFIKPEEEKITTAAAVEEPVIEAIETESPVESSN